MKNKKLILLILLLILISVLVFWYYNTRIDKSSNDNSINTNEITGNNEQSDKIQVKSDIFDGIGKTNAQLKLMYGEISGTYDSSCSKCVSYGNNKLARYGYNYNEIRDLKDTDVADTIFINIEDLLSNYKNENITKDFLSKYFDFKEISMNKEMGWEIGMVYTYKGIYEITIHNNDVDNTNYSGSSSITITHL